MSTPVCTRDDFARAVLEEGLSFPLDPSNYNRIAFETGFIKLPPAPVQSDEQVALEADVARLNDEYRAAAGELALAELAAAGNTRTVVARNGYDTVRNVPDAGKSDARIQAASDRVMEIQTALRAAKAKLRRTGTGRPSRLSALLAGFGR